jgi:hypothetical protein
MFTVEIVGWRWDDSKSFTLYVVRIKSAQYVNWSRSIDSVVDLPTVGINKPVLVSLLRIVMEVCRRYSEFITLRKEVSFGDGERGKLLLRCPVDGAHHC